MSYDITVYKLNESYLKIECDEGILYEMKEKFSFYVDNYKYMPKYKNKMWDGKISLLDIREKTLYIGLFNEFERYANELGYTVDKSHSDPLYGSLNDKEDILPEEILDYTKSLNIHSNGVPLKIRAYQIASIYNCIKYQRQISLTPTGGGKSYIAYVVIRWFLENKSNGSFMLVVPRLSLVNQMYTDFIDYSSHNGFDVEDNCQIIADGKPKNVHKKIVICTWQSIFRMSPDWFNGNFNVIMADECHEYKSDCIKGIFEKATKVKYRIGVTGSLDKVTTNKMILKGLIGEISKVKSTRDLIEEGYLSELKIKAITLKYNKDTRKLISKTDYKQEVDFLCEHKKRNNFIKKLSLSLKGNTLILYNFVERHGIPLYKIINESAINHNVYIVHGKINVDTRDDIRNAVKSSDENNIIVASFGTFSMGINIPNIHNIIFASPTKSIIRVIQSLGRGLRRAKDKEYLTVFDIADFMGTKSNPNTTYEHFVERLQIYTDEEHEYKLLEVEIE